MPIIVGSMPTRGVAIRLRSSGSGRTVITRNGQTLTSYDPDFVVFPTDPISLNFENATTSQLVSLTRFADSVIGSQNGDVIRAGDGNDTIVGGSRAGTDDLSGEDGNDLILADGDGGLRNSAVASGRAPDWTSIAEAVGAARPSAGAGAPPVLSNRASGGNGADTLVGGSGRDVLSGDAGDDLIAAGGGDDLLYGGDGNDVLHGGSGSDTLDGGGGNDTLYGERAVSGVAGGQDRISGGAGNDLIQTSVNLSDTTQSRGVYDGGSGNDRIILSAGFTGTVAGGDSADLLDGSRTLGNALTKAGVYFSGGNGTDTIHGGAGNDTADGGSGADTLSLGNGDDIAIFRATELEPWAGVIDTYDGGDGIDTLRIDVSFDFLNNNYSLIQNLIRNFPSNGQIGNSWPNVAGGSTPGVLNPGLIWRNFEKIEVYVGGRQLRTDLSGVGTLPLGGPLQPIATEQDDIVLASLVGVLNGTKGYLDLLGGNDIFIGASKQPLANFPLGGSQTVRGGAGDDTLIGTQPSGSAASPNGRWDSFTFFGDAGNDVLQGGAGDDSLDGGVGRNKITGGLGRDTITAAEGSEMSGGDGDDTIRGSGLAGTVAGRFYNDVIQGDAGNDTITGGGIGNSRVMGGDDNDLIDYTKSSGANTLDGGNGNDTVLGGSGGDRLFGGAGNDSFKGGIGHDAIDGGAGDDGLEGGDGNDILSGGGGNDTLDGGRGADSLAFLSEILIRQRDNMAVSFGANGDQTFWASLTDFFRSRDVFSGGDGEDTVVGSTGSDMMAARVSGENVLYFQGIEQVSSGAGNDVLDFSGADRAMWLLGGDNADLVIGSAFNDTINAFGSDTLVGGAGADRFIYDSRINQTNTITDFKVGEDKVVFNIMMSENASSRGISARDDSFVFGDDRQYGAIVTIDDTTINLIGVKASDFLSRGYAWNPDPGITSPTLPRP